jgi:hypothetical protein
MLMGSLALALVVAGVAVLRLVWRRHSPAHTAARLGAWALIAAGLVPAVAAAGAEFGTVLAVLLPGLVAAAVVLAGAERRPPNPALRPRRSLAPATPATLGREGLRALALLGLCPAVAGALALALARLTTSTDNDALAVVLVGFSLIWGGLATAVMMSTRPLRAGAGVAVLGLLTIPVLA